ncbi:MAG: hypothetical protein MN733_03860 [Nitrososphaera sp.]|nr:hypothetical protein [Nitrososphaera sp.]
MPLNSSRWITHKFMGGWATDFGTTVYTSPDQAGHLEIPFLKDARNIIYEFDGGPRKAPGANVLNTSEVASGATVTGIYDYWRQGTAASATQRRVLHAGTVIMADTADGVFANIGTGLVSGAIPQYSTFDDLLVIGSSSVSDVPRSWDQSTFQVLAGSPPRFSFSVSHRNHQWAAGDYSNPSRLYYSKTLDPEDWTDSTSGSIDIDPSDGDMITGIISHKNELWVFKGPNKGSIHRITGSAEADFARTTFVVGLPVAWIHSIFRFGDDIGFITAYGTVHSLKATAAFADYNQAYFSYPIGTYVRESLNHSRSQYFTSVNDPNNGRVWIGITPSGSQTNTRHLIMDYRFLSQNESYPRWSYWDAQSFASLAYIRDANARPRVFSGGYNGFVYRHGQENRTVNGSAINYRLETPAFTYGDEWLLKNVGDIALSIDALNNNSMTVGWTGDGTTTNTTTVTQGAVGGQFDDGLFDTAVFGGQTFIPRFCGIENGGDFRSVAYIVTDTANNSDISIHSLLAKLTPAGESQENS